MKKTSSIAICALLLCSTVLIVSNVRPANAFNSNYQITEYYNMSPTVTVDGKWSSSDEWHDTAVQYMGTPQVALFEYKMDISGSSYLMTFLLEFADRTNNTGDLWQVIIDGGNAGGSVPNSNDVRFDIVGHTTLNVYVGNGATWASSSAAVTWKDSLATSPHDPSTHWILEFQFDKNQFSWGANPPPFGLRVAMSDASNVALGTVAWPPTSTQNTPDSWGSISTYGAAPAPEGLSIVAMVLVSAVAVLSASYYLRKRPRTTSFTPAKP